MVARDQICARDEQVLLRPRRLLAHIKSIPDVAHHGVDHHERLAPRPARGADSVDGARGDFDLVRGSEIAGEDRVGQFEQAVGGDAIQHVLHRGGGHGRAARLAPARMAAEQRRGHMDRINLQGPQHVGRYAPANAGSGDIG